MRHRKGNKKLNKPTDQRIALLRNQVLNLITHNRIQTTVTRAKEVKKMAENLITLSTKQTLHARRTALKILPNAAIVSKLFNEIGPKYKEKQGGYTRIFRVGNRKGDSAPIALLELVE